MIPYGKQFIDNSDIRAVLKALKKDKITTGETVLKFEHDIKNFLKCNYAVSCNSGTSALFLALSSIGLKKNDNLIMPAINFVSSYNVVKILGANIFLADVDKFTGQMRPGDVYDCVKKNNLKKIKAIIVMYNGGYPQNSTNFYDIKKKFGSYLIEDACHALGAAYHYKKKTYKIGSCKHVDISTFSFHPLKTITTGEGGLVTTNNKQIYKKIENLRSIGINRSSKKHWEYDVINNGLNFRLTDFQCALGISQLKKIKKFINKRKKIFELYNKELSNNDKFKILNHHNDCLSSHHLYILHINNFNNKKKDKFIKYMKSKNIILQYHYIPIYYFKVFHKKNKFKLKNSEIYYRSSISLPIFYELDKKKQIYIIDCIKKYFKF